MDRDLVLIRCVNVIHGQIYFGSLSVLYIPYECSVLDTSKCKRKRGGGCNDRVSESDILQKMVLWKYCIYRYNEQKAIMKGLDVNFLDVWATTCIGETTYRYIGEHWHVNGDAQHDCIVFG